MLTRYRFPWQQLERGQAFFVPCLDPKPMMEHGLKQAVSVRVLNARAEPGIYGGAIGVLFYVPPPSPSRTTRSSSA
jgi:hypothetical protein